MCHLGATFLARSCVARSLVSWLDVYVCMYVRVCTHTHIGCVCVCMCACIYTQMHTHTHIPAFMDILLLNGEYHYNSPPRIP